MCMLEALRERFNKVIIDLPNTGLASVNKKTDDNVSKGISVTYKTKSMTRPNTCFHYHIS